MPSFDIVKEHKAEETSFRVKSVMGMFDLDSSHIKEHFVGKLDLPDDWQVGVIYGASGTGKSTIAKELFKDELITSYEYSHNSIVDDMPENKTIKEITQAFSSVGFSSPPSWLKPYAVLSNGEKMRVDLARAILSDQDMIVFDEYTSVVNREVAKVGSFAIQKAIRKTNKKFVAVACHSDIVDWLEPDWVFCTDDMSFQTVKKNDPTSTSVYTKPRAIYGKCLENITI